MPKSPEANREEKFNVMMEGINNLIGAFVGLSQRIEELNEQLYFFNSAFQELHNKKEQESATAELIADLWNKLASKRRK